MDIQVNMIYLIDAKPYENKQCRYKIEATGLLPDESMKRREASRGGSPGLLGLGFVKHFDESVALDVI